MTPPRARDPGRGPRRPATGREPRRDPGGDGRLSGRPRPSAPPGPDRLHIDWTACDGRGLCTELLPELLDRDEWGYPVPRQPIRDPVIPPHLRAYAERAVASCPMVALRLLGS